MRYTMRKIPINALVDIGCLVTFIPSLISGIILYLALPSGGGRGGGSGVCLVVPYWIPGIGALSCIGLIAFLSPNSWIIGCIGLLIGVIWFFFHSQVGT